MQTFIILLRGINVGGRNKIRMADLKDALIKNGFRKVKTYIQSGNIVVGSEGSPTTNEVSQRIRSLLLEKFQLDVSVQVLDSQSFIQAYSSNPFRPEGKENLAPYHLTILQEAVTNYNQEDFDAFITGADDFRLRGRFVYLFIPESYQKTKLSNAFFEKKFKTKATTRNWKTIAAIANLLKQD